MGSGPLNGVKIIEFAGLGPAPFCCMLLSDLGADIVRIDRKGGKTAKYDVMSRGRRSVALNLKDADDKAKALALASKADVLVEGFRPGVMERLSFGPDTLLAANPRLIYGRMTGWGQTGPLAHAAGHDINYISLTGALHAVGRRNEPPPPPLNFFGDFGGGALYLAMGICAALVEAKASGKGQIIDCAMTDGAASLMAPFYGMMKSGQWLDQRDSNLFDGGAHFYDSYECADGKFISLGSLEPEFYALMLEKTGLKDDPAMASQMDRAAWPGQSEKVAAMVKTKTREEWRVLLEGADVCFAPILSMAEAPFHPHNIARQTFIEANGVVQPNVAPRFSRTPSSIQGPPPEIGADEAAVLADWGVTPG